MRILLFFAFALALFATFWCATGYVFAPAQSGETRAELSTFVGQPLPAQAVEIHSSRVLQQGRNSGIASLFAGASAVLILAYLLGSRKKRSDAPKSNRGGDKPISA